MEPSPLGTCRMVSRREWRPPGPTRPPEAPRIPSAFPAARAPRSSRRRRRDAGGVEAVVAVEVRRRADQAVLVADAVAAQRHGRAVVGEHLGDGAAEAAEHVVLLDGHQPPSCAAAARAIAARRAASRCACRARRRRCPSAAQAPRPPRAPGCTEEPVATIVRSRARAVLDRLAELEVAGCSAGVHVRLPAAADAEVDRLRPVDGGADRAPPASAASAGATTVRPAIARMIARSSVAWCEVP